MLIINHINKKKNNRIILNDISFTVKRGEIAVLLGASGVGKSTLLRVLNGLEGIDTGKITLDGQPLNTQINQATHAVGMVFQQFNLFPHLTASENIQLALEKVLNMSQQDAKTAALELLTQYELADKKDSYPHQLSGGQQQRLAIARAIALKPQVLCLDEPTSALDPLLTSHVAQLIMKLASEGYAIVLTTHDMSLIQQLTCTIYLMDAGTIVESAQSSEYMKQPHEYPQLHRFIKGR